MQGQVDLIGDHRYTAYLEVGLAEHINAGREIQMWSNRSLLPSPVAKSDANP